MRSLTNIPGTLIARSMGRPPLSKKSGTVETKVRMTDETRQRIEALTGDQGMAAFIREAVERELKRREKAKER